MAGLGTSFDATQHDTEQRDFENLPIGDYELEVTESEVKQTNNQDGTGIKLTYGVLAPEEYKGRKLFSWINIEHKNAQAQEIGQKELASLCRACGLTTIDDTEQLHFIRFTAKVGLGKPSTKNGVEYPARNEIKKFYFPDEGAVPTAKAPPKPANDNAPAPASKPAAAPAAASGKDRPWGKKK
jgi:hypothetical protein